MKPPDLQALVLRHGAYDKITAEAWRVHDAGMAAYRAHIRGPVAPPVSRNVAASNKGRRDP